jgi:hypothetical protein
MVFYEDFHHLAQTIWKWQPFKVKLVKTIFEKKFQFEKLQFKIKLHFDIITYKNRRFKSG